MSKKEALLPIKCIFYNQCSL